jgi:hypothetical protein
MDDDELRREGQTDNGSLGRVGRSFKATSQKMSKCEKKAEKIQQLLKMYPTFPVDSIINVKHWLNDPTLQFLNLKDKYVSNILSNWSRQLLSWNIYDYNEFYSDVNCNPIFSAGYEDYDKYYYSKEDSVDIMIKFLTYQFYDQQEHVLQFVTDLYNVLEKIIPKQNSILVFSPPECGKSWFFDPFMNYYLCVGKICTVNRYQPFGLQECYAKRLVHWNEPNYDPELIDKFKELLGGDTTTVAVKYMPDMIVYRTPFIITTNVRISIMNHPAFKQRCCHYVFRPAPHLKQMTKKINPLAVFNLFKHYNLVKDNDKPVNDEVIIDATV